MKQLWQKIEEIINFFHEKIWKLDFSKLKGSKYYFYQSLKTLTLAVRNYIKDNCSLRASALTFYSLLSVVPVLAMAFGIAKGFNLEKLLEEEMIKNLKGQEQILNQFLAFSHSMLDTAKGGVVAGFGLIVLIYTVMKLLENIEESLNAVWETNKSRALVRKFTDYLSIMVFAPILIVIAGGLNVFVVTNVQYITEQIKILGYFSDIIFFFLQFLPYTIIWLLFTLVYLVMPNVKVNFTSAILAGIVAGTAYQVTQSVYINFQIGVTKYNAIYGSFAALPLFLAWLQLSWMIILFGAELSFAIQNKSRYVHELDYSQISASSRKLLGLMIMRALAKNFEKGDGHLTARDLCLNLNLSLRLVTGSLKDLMASRLISEVRIDEKLFAYQPAKDVHKITVYSVFNALEKLNLDGDLQVDSKENDNLKENLKCIDEMIKGSPQNQVLLNL
jgi:membrane protein